MCLCPKRGKDFHVTATASGGLSIKAGSDTITTPPLSLLAIIRPSALALMALKASGLVTDLAAALKGLVRQTSTCSKAERRKSDPADWQNVWLDGAHNVHGAKALVASLYSLYPHKWTIIFGALNTRPADEFLSVIEPVADLIYCLTVPDQPAALEAGTLVSRARSLGLKAETVDDISSACRAIGKVGATDDRPVIICGSLYLAGAVLQANGTLPN